MSQLTRALDFRPYALSELVNTLRQSEKRILFGFLINGAFLQTSIQQYLTANGISAETTLAVEYVRAVTPPQYLGSFEHDDWVSSVDVLSATSLSGQRRTDETQILPGRERILSGCYDGSLKVWNTSSQVIATSFCEVYTTNKFCSKHFKGVMAAKFINPTHIASSCMHGCVTVSKYTEDALVSSASIKPKLKLYGHKGHVSAISVHPTSNRILTASIDRSLGFFATTEGEAPPEPPPQTESYSQPKAKRPKIEPIISTPRRGPLSMMKSHEQQVSDTMFNPNDPTVAYSTSWDHTLKTWDLATSACVDTRTTQESLFSLTALPSLNLVAVGTFSDIFLIDPRTTATTVSAMTLKGHRNLVASLAPNPDSPHGLLSGSHEGCCRIWDVRGAMSDKDGRVGKCTYMIKRESLKSKPLPETGSGAQVFSVCWDKDIGILSASEDNRVQIDKVEGSIGGEGL